MDLFQRNLEELGKRDREAYEKVKEEIVDESIEFFPSKDGSPNIRFHGIPIHSPYSPIKEARKLAEKAQGDITVLGVGLGYHIEELLKKGFRDFTVVEPFPRLLKAFLMTGDRRDTLKKIKIKLGLDVKPDGTKLITLPSYNRLCRTFVERWSSRNPKVYLDIPLDILVVGAIYGGTVPIAKYVADAFSELGHRVHLLNFQDFYNGYQLIKRFSENTGFQRILLDRLTDLLGDMVFMKAVEEKVDLVFAVAQAPIPPKIIEKLKEQNIATAYWFTEDHLVMTYWEDIAHLYDMFLVIQEDAFLEELERKGVYYLYLPLACHPKIHRPLELSKEEKKRYGSDVSFVGAGYYNRRNFFKALADMENFKIWGSEWEGCWELQERIQEGGRRVSTEECVKIFNATKININLHSSPYHRGINPQGDYVNPRTFEIAACGAFQLVDPRRKLGEFFKVGEELITFSSEKELRALIEHYLKRDDERKEIAQKSRNRALKEHTYIHRIKAFLEEFFSKFHDRFREEGIKGPKELEGVLKTLSCKRIKNLTPRILLKELRKEKREKAVSDHELLLMIMDEIWTEAMRKKREFLWEYAGRFS